MTTLLVAVALKGSVILLAAWGVTALLQKATADLRHRVWLAALCGMLLLLVPIPVPEAARVDVVYTFTAEASAKAVQTGVPAWRTIWAIGAGLLTLRFLAAVIRLAMLSRAAGGGDVRVSDSISTPMTWGVLRPVILLPGYSSAWPEEKRSIAIAHERAHIARGDWFWQSFAQVVQMVFWFHPLVWLAVSRLRQEAELAVDDVVVASGAEASEYAEQLLDVAKHVRLVSPVMAVAMVRRPVLTARVAAILDATRDRTRAGLRSRIAIVVAALCVVPILAAFQSRQVQSLPAPVPVGVPTAAPTIRPVSPKAPRILAQAAPVPAPVPVQRPAPAPTPAPRTEPFPIGAGVSAPVAIYRQEPEYSLEAREAKYQGEVWLSVEIDENGIPTNIAVTRPLGLGLDEKAVEAVRAWRFKPGMKDGQPVRVKATLAVSFHLQ